MNIAKNRAPMLPTGPMTDAVAVHDELLPREGVLIDGQIWFTVEQIADHMHYADVTSVHAYTRRAGAALEPLTILAVLPGSRCRINRRLYSEEAVYMIIMLSTGPRAAELGSLMVRRMMDLNVQLIQCLEGGAQ